MANLPKNKIKEPDPVPEITEEKQNSKKRSNKSVDKSRHVEAWKKIFGVFLFVFAVYSVLSMISFLVGYINSFIPPVEAEYDGGSYLLNDKYVTQNFMGKFGDILAIFFIKKLFGISSFILIFALLYYSMVLLFKKKILKKNYVIPSLLFLTLFFSVTFALFFHDVGPDNSNILIDIFPGTFGLMSYEFLHHYLGTVGLGIVLAVIFLIYCYFRYHVNVLTIFTKKGDNEEECTTNVENNEKSSGNGNETVNNEEVSNNNEKEEDIDDSELGEITLVTRTKNKDVTDTIDNKYQQDNVNGNRVMTSDSSVELVERPTEETIPEEEIQKHFTIDTKYDPTLDLPNYKMPPLSLLNDYNNGESDITNEEIENNRQNIRNTLHNYSIEIQSIKATVGPTITLYEIIPAPGVRIAKIKNLEDDIALSLAAIGIRIIAPIPGRGTIGIEVPNSKPQIVSMKSVLSSKKFIESTYELPIALGKTIQNESFVTDLTKMPHMLVAGATGQGKSVGLNAIITSLLYKKHPAQLKFVLVDPKKVELPLYAKIERHYLAKLPNAEDAIITDTKNVVNTLNSLILEMEARYNLLKLSGVRNIKEYNERFVARRLNPENGHRFMPYIVVIIDEFADLIMTAGREVESPLTRLAQLARATGIHLIIATQRPSVNIITGTIKANFPARLAFRVVSKIDSRTILDSGGADQLIGRGDMLLSTGSDLIRMQCAFVDTDEIERLTEFIGNQTGYPTALYLPEYSGDSADNQVNGGDMGERDPLFAEVAHLVVSSGNGSTSNIQRKMNLGYNRAGRIMDQLEAAGIVGPAVGSKPRELYVQDEEELNVLLENLK